MQPKFIAPEIAVGPQLTPDQIGELAAGGFRSIIANRPEGESADQPSFEETRRLAERHGMQVRFIPIAPGKQTPADVKASAKRWRNCPSRSTPIAAPARARQRSGLFRNPAGCRTRTSCRRPRTPATTSVTLFSKTACGMLDGATAFAAS